MNAETLAALKASIQHWRENEGVLFYDRSCCGPETCALCYLFYEISCDGCPIASYTGYVECDGSPYRAAYSALKDFEFEERWGRSWVGYWRAREAFHLAARDERLFLESLLPEGAQ